MKPQYSMDKQSILNLEILEDGSVNLGFNKDAATVLGQLAVDAFNHSNYDPLMLIVDALAEFCASELSGKLEEDLIKKIKELSKERRVNRFQNYN